jgi:sporulation related protein
VRDEWHWRPICARALVLAALLLGGCGVDRDFDAAIRANTVVAFDDYLRLHPDGAHAADARARLAALVEEREWQRTRGLGTADAYQQYLRGYPQGAHAKDAVVAISDLNLAALPSTEAAPAGAAPATAVPPPLARARTAAPAGAPPRLAASAPRPAPDAGTGGVRIQLGAFATETAANAAWQRLRTRHPELAGRAMMLSAGTAADGRRLKRLQVAGFDRDGAAAACAALTKANDPCLIVPATGAAPR